MYQKRKEHWFALVSSLSYKVRTYQARMQLVKLSCCYKYQLCLPAPFRVTSDWVFMHNVTIGLLPVSVLTKYIATRLQFIVSWYADVHCFECTAQSTSHQLSKSKEIHNERESRLKGIDKFLLLMDCCMWGCRGPSNEMGFRTASFNKLSL
jgi:hypothetical protein